MNAANWYLDTSALLPYYRNEPATQSVQAFLSSLARPIIISDLTEVEAASALSRLVRSDELTEAQAGLVEQIFADDVRSGLFVRISVARKTFQQAQQ